VGFIYNWDTNSIKRKLQINSKNTDIHGIKLQKKKKTNGEEKNIYKKQEKTRKKTPSCSLVLNKKRRGRKNELESFFLSFLLI
jgi:hypothetical protein